MLLRAAAGASFGPGDHALYGMRVAAVVRIEPWFSVVALMGLIFFLSAQPDLSTGLGAWDVVLRKIAHAGEYALLTVLWWRALRTGGLTAQRAAIIALAASVGYAATDEYHQTFVEGRRGSAIDVGIDALGAGLAAIVLARRR